MLTYTILLVLWISVNILVFYYYNLHYIYYLSYYLAYIPYYFSKKRNEIITENLKTTFPEINVSKINYINFNSWKFFFINFLLCSNQYLFGDSFLCKYYQLDDKLTIPNKSFFAQGHHGIYYDFTNIHNLTSNSLCCIYKGNFQWNIKNKYVNLVQHKNLDLKLINKYHILASPIDQKSRGIKLNFLNKEVTFNNFLIDYSKSNTRDIYFYNVVFRDFKLKVKIIKIEQKDKTIEEITRELAKNIETSIRKYPEQYFWAHNRFNI